MLARKPLFRLFEFLKRENSANLQFFDAKREISQIHYPVMKNEVLSLIELHNKNNSFFLDCTFGCGGHSLAILNKNRDMNGVALDIDKRMVKRFYEEAHSNKENHENSDHS